MEDKINIPFSLFYLPSINRFVDEQWCIVHDLSILFDTWVLDEYKKTKKDGVLQSRNGDFWSLYYLHPNEEAEVLNFISWNESFEIPMVRGYF